MQQGEGLLSSGTGEMQESEICQTHSGAGQSGKNRTTACIDSFWLVWRCGFETWVMAVASLRFRTLSGHHVPRVSRQVQQSPQPALSAMRGKRVCVVSATRCGTDTTLSNSCLDVETSGDILNRLYKVHNLCRFIFAVLSLM
jgi:hypothetical protein